MTELVSNSYQIPEESDDSATLINLLRENFRRLAEHNHGGDASEKLAPTAAASNAIETYSGSNLVWVKDNDNNIVYDAQGLATATINTNFTVTNTTPIFYGIPVNPVSAGKVERLYLDYFFPTDTSMTIFSNYAYSSLTVNYA